MSIGREAEVEGFPEEYFKEEEDIPEVEELVENRTRTKK